MGGRDGKAKRDDEVDCDAKRGRRDAAVVRVRADVLPRLLPSFVGAIACGVL